MKFSLAKMFGFFVILSGCLVAFCVVKNFDEGETNLQASDAALGAIKDFVSIYKRWPKSQSELEGSSSFNGHYQWPRDAKEVCERVKIDFDLSLRDVVDRGTGDWVIDVKKPVPELALKTRYDFFLTFVNDVLEGKNPSSTEKDIRVPN